MITQSEEINTEQVAQDIKFLLSFAPATSADQVVPGLFPTAYVTLSYEGDLEIAKRIEAIVRRYDISLEEEDDLPDI